MKKIAYIVIMVLMMMKGFSYADSMAGMNMGSMDGMGDGTQIVKPSYKLGVDLKGKVDKLVKGIKQEKLEKLSNEIVTMKNKIMSGKLTVKNQDMVLALLDYIGQSVELKKNDILNLPTVKDYKIVELKDGDVYNIDVTYVRKNINGKDIKMYAYNGSVPGPVIKVKQGSEITIRLTNKINDIQIAMHSHGVRVEPMFDGVLKAMKGSQDPITYGKTFEYKIKFPDAGIYWYHPHMQEDAQQQLGAYGAFVVSPTDDDYYSKVNKEDVLMLGDVLMNSGGVVPFDLNLSNYTLMGRYGNVLMVNGKTDYKLDVNKGDVVRFYIVNTANARPFNFKIPGVKIKLVGSDMSKYENENYIDSVVIAPGERYIVEAYFPASGQYKIQNQTSERTYDLGTINVSSKSTLNDYSLAFNTLRTDKNLSAEFAKFSQYFDKSYDKKISMKLIEKGMGDMNGMSMDDMMGGTGEMIGSTGHVGGLTGTILGLTNISTGSNIEFEDTNPLMNANSNANMYEWQLVDDDTNLSGSDINWTFKKGDLVKIRIYNDPNGMHPMQHPIHFHGQRFVVLSKNGVNNDDMVWKDTVLLGAGDSVDILLDASNIGQWMAHCHIAEHLSAGMMLFFNVKE